MSHKMLFSAVLLMIGLLAWPAFCGITPSNSVSDNYLKAIADHFNVTYKDVLSIAETVPLEQVPIVFYVAQRASTSVTRVMEMKEKNPSWAETASRMGVNAQYFYVIVAGTITSNIFAPIFEKFNSTPSQDWRKLRLTDEEIVNLVNLRLLYSHYDYSAYKVMAFRDTNNSWCDINKMVAEAKHEYLVKEMAEKTEK